MLVRKPLSARPLDAVYFSFFLMHIPATLLIDCQSILPAWLYPQAIRDFLNWYITFSGDPLIRGLKEGAKEFAWFKSFITLELVFQVPVFFIGAYCLYYNIAAVYPLLLVYGASTVTTLLPCLSILLAPASSLSHVASSALSPPPLTAFQTTLLLSSYGPFLLLPLILTIDMAGRLHASIVQQTGRNVSSKPAQGWGKRDRDWSSESSPMPPKSSKQLRLGAFVAIGIAIALTALGSHWAWKDFIRPVLRRYCESMDLPTDDWIYPLCVSLFIDSPPNASHPSGIDWTSWWDHALMAWPLLVPVVSWFVIANWVGWEYFRYA